MVGEIKKGRYVYYHCTGQKEKCPKQHYAREEAIEAQFADVIEQITLPPIFVDWVSEVFSESHRDAKELQAAAIQRLKAEHSRIQKRLDTMYLDKFEVALLLTNLTGSQVLGGLNFNSSNTGSRIKMRRSYRRIWATV